MSNGLHHPNYAIMALEKELYTHRDSLKGWSEESKSEYSEAWKRAHKEIKELENAIETLCAYDSKISKQTTLF